MVLRRPGFSLLEVVLAVGLLGAIFIFYHATLKGVELSRYGASEDLALRIAANKMEDLRAAGYAALPGSGSFSDSMLSALPSGTATLAVSTYNAKMKKVLVTINWVEPGGGSRSLVIATLMVDSGGL